jgi:nucleoside-diphosphate-sugar epimerase
MKILLAGATGVIGQRLIPLLTASGHEVIGTTRQASKTAHLRNLGVTPRVVDVFDRDGIAALLHETRPDVVIHQLTDLSDKDFLANDYSANTRMREVGTRNLVDAARAVGVRRFIAQSIAAWVYAAGAGPADENTPLDSEAPAPVGDIVKGVLALERAVAEMEIGVALRYGALYGPGTVYAPDGVVADLVRRGQMPADEGVTSFLHVDDAARAALLALDWPQGVVNIVDDEPAKGTDWLPVYAATLGAPVPPITTGQESTTRGASNKKARQVLHWSPIYPSWREGFVQTAQEWNKQKGTSETEKA